MYLPILFEFLTTISNKYDTFLSFESFKIMPCGNHIATLFEVQLSTQTAMVKNIEAMILRFLRFSSLLVI